MSQEMEYEDFLTTEHYEYTEKEDSPRHQHIEDYYRHHPSKYSRTKINKIADLRKKENREERQHIKEHIERNIQTSLHAQIGSIGPSPPPALERKFMRAKGNLTVGQDSRGRWFLKDLKGKFAKWKK